MVEVVNRGAPAPAEAVPGARIWRAALAALAANLVGIGLARFAFTPLIPALAAAGWFTANAATYLGAANLAGYLVGALLGRRMLAIAHPPVLLRVMLLTVAASFFAGELSGLGFAWFFLWRFVSGYAGGAIMVLAAPTVLAATPMARRGSVGGFIFTGVGIGIVLSGTLIPFMLRIGGLEAAWAGLGVLSLLLILVSWGGWPPTVLPPRTGVVRHVGRLPLRVAALLASYALIAGGLVPHMLFLVAFISQGLGRGIEIGSAYWVLFGFGAMAGPILAGRLADSIGFGRTLRIVYVVQALVIVLPAFTASDLWLAVSSAVTGASIPGVVTLVLGRLHELIHDSARQQRFWGYATTCFALAQAAAAYGYAFLFDLAGAFAPLFVTGAGLMLAALAVDFAAGGYLILRRRPG